MVLKRRAMILSVDSVLGGLTMREILNHLILLCTVFEKNLTLQLCQSSRDYVQDFHCHSQQSIPGNPCEIYDQKRGIGEVYSEILGYLFSTIHQNSIIFCSQTLALLQIRQPRMLQIGNSSTNVPVFRFTQNKKIKWN